VGEIAWVASSAHRSTSSPDRPHTTIIPSVVPPSGDIASIEVATYAVPILGVAVSRSPIVATQYRRYAIDSGEQTQQPDGAIKHDLQATHPP
jgi:hypothetical protein